MTTPPQVELSVADKMNLLKATWPDDCQAIGDHYLEAVVRGPDNLVMTDDGHKYDLKVILEILTATLNVIAAICAVVASRPRSRSLDPREFIAELDRLGVSRSDFTEDALRALIFTTTQRLADRRTGVPNDSSETT